MLWVSEAGLASLNGEALTLNPNPYTLNPKTRASQDAERGGSWQAFLDKVAGGFRLQGHWDTGFAYALNSKP